MCCKPQESAGTDSACPEAEPLEWHKRRTEYAARRMAAALQRMGDMSLSSDEWEQALKWATIWGMATRIGPRCRRTHTCARAAESCGLDRSD